MREGIKQRSKGSHEMIIRISLSSLHRENGQLTSVAAFGSHMQMQSELSKDNHSYQIMPTYTQKLRSFEIFWSWRRSVQWLCNVMFRGVINGKAGKAAALPKFSDTLTLSQSGEQIKYAPPLALPHLKFSCLRPWCLLHISKRSKTLQGHWTERHKDQKIV